MEKIRQAVILAGGLGTRLRPLTEAIPKPLLPIGEKSILEVQISRLKKFGITEIFIATNYKAEYIKSFIGKGDRFGLDIRFSKEEKPLGTCGPINLLKEDLKDNFVVMNGDILSTINFNKLFKFGECVESDFVVVTKELIIPYAFGQIHSNGDFITDIEEKPNLKNEIVAGIYLMNPKIFSFIPDNTYFGMDNLIKKLLQNGIRVAKYLMKDVWLDIGQLPDYEKAQEFYDDHFNEG